MQKDTFFRTFEFKGRASRKEFWGYIVVVFLFVFIIVGIADEEGIADNSLAMDLIIVGSFILTLSVSDRRLHDVGKSGMLVLFPMAAHLFRVTINELWSSDTLGTALIVIQLAVNIYLLALFCSQSQGNNKYGPKPVE